MIVEQLTDGLEFAKCAARKHGNAGVFYIQFTGLYSSTLFHSHWAKQKIEIDLLLNVVSVHIIHFLSLQIWKNNIQIYIAHH